jgi:hypothetical protein
MEKNCYIPEGVRMQHCSNPIYNSDAYTHEMLMEDWDKGCCRLWTPQIQKGKHHEK